MATDELRSVLRRSLPAVLFLLLTLVVAPQRPAPLSGPVASAPAAAGSSAEPADAVVSDEASEPGVPVDRSTVLVAQFTAGVCGSRAPPAASA